MQPFLGLLIIILATGCGAHPLLPASAVADGLVMLENFCEDPVTDAQTLTPIEATADMLALPYTMVIGTLRLIAYATVGVGMVLAGHEAKATIDQINWVLPWGFAGPNPDQIHPKDMVVLAEGCL